LNQFSIWKILIFRISYVLLSDTVSTVTLSTKVPEMCCVVASYLTNRISASDVQFRAGSSIRGQGGTLHPAAQLILHPRFNYFNYDFDVAVCRVSDNVLANHCFWKTILNWTQTRLMRRKILFAI